MRVLREKISEQENERKRKVHVKVRVFSTENRRTVCAEQHDRHRHAHNNLRNERTISSVLVSRAVRVPVSTTFYMQLQRHEVASRKE